MQTSRLFCRDAAASFSGGLLAEGFVIVEHAAGRSSDRSGGGF